MKNKKNTLLYETIAEKLIECIRSGKYPKGDRIPSEEVLSREFEVSRPTIKRAIKLLERKGIVRCRSNVGTFVLKSAPEITVVGYVTPDLADPFHAEFIQALESELSSHDISLIVAEGSDVEAATLKLAKNGAAGALICKKCPMLVNPKQIALPHVWCCGIPDKAKAWGIGLDNRKGIFEIMQHFVSLGVKTFGYISTDRESLTSDTRFLAFHEFINKHNLKNDPHWQYASPVQGEQGGIEAFNKIYNSKEVLPEAIVCFNDWTALGVIKAALSCGIDIPGKLKVSGFDNLIIGRYSQITVTTYDYRIPVIVKESVDALLKTINSPRIKTHKKLIQGKLIVRQSSGDYT